MNRHIVLGSIVNPLYTFESHKKVERYNNHTILASHDHKVEIDVSWLPAAAETYKISPDIRDYIVVALPIVTCDIPNRNLQCFALEEMAFFDPMYGKMIYQTFCGKPTHIDHDNQDPTKAKGIHVDASLEYVPKWDIWKIKVMTLWDRTKDTRLVNDILSKRRTGYSMGCYVNDFLCSVCGEVDEGPGGNQCTHMKEKGSLFNDALAFQLCSSCNFFECSSVSDPADVTALSEDIWK